MNVILELKADSELLGALVAIKESLEQILSYKVSTQDEAQIEAIEGEQASTNVKSKESEVITLEAVRAVLAAKSQTGKQPEVKALITKYGGKKLTDLEPSCYAELLQEAQVL